MSHKPRFQGRAATGPEKTRPSGTHPSDAAHTARLLAFGAKAAEPLGMAFLSGHRTYAADQFGEAFLQTATSGMDDGEYGTEQVLIEESGGPFIESSAQVEFARGTDESNPAGAKVSPFPRT